MKRKMFAALIIFAMLISLLAACSGNNDTSPEPEVSTAATEPSSAETAPDPVEGSSPQVSLWGTTSIMQYPLVDETVELTYWNPYPQYLTGILDSVKDHQLWDDLTQITGVDLVITEVSETAANEQFNLMIASEEYSDILPVTKYYTGGVVKAYEDGVIIELSDLISENAPDYDHAVDSFGENTRKLLTTDDGQVLQMYSISTEYQNTLGLSIRQDWLDKLGIDAPHTVDELYDTLMAFKTEMGSQYPLRVGTGGVLEMVTGAFGIEEFSTGSTMVMGNSGGIGLFQMDGTAYCTLTQDDFRTYLEFFLKLINDGLVDPEFYSADSSPMAGYGDQSSGVNGIWAGNADSWETLKGMSDDPDFSVCGISTIVMNEGDEYKFGGAKSQLGMSGLSIASTCQIPDIAISYLNYFFTDEGYLLANFGIEGESYTFDDSGLPVLTDKVLNNENGWNIPGASHYYSMGQLIGLTETPRFYPGYSDEMVNAMNLWASCSTGEYSMPAVTLTTEESAEFTNLSSDIITYAVETVLGWLSQSSALDDASWDEFQSHLKEMNIDQCVAYYQAALNRFNAR